MSSRRGLRAAALLWLAAAAATGALAQEATNTLGPPSLKDFQLPGQRTSPPPATTNPAPTPAPTTSTPPPAARPAETTARQPAAPPPRSPAPERRAPAPATATAPSREITAPAAPQASAPVPETPLPDANASAPAPLPQTPVDAAPVPEPAQDAQPVDRSIWYIAAAAAAALLLIGGFALLRRRRRADDRLDEQVRDEAREELGGALFAGKASPLPAQREPDPAPAAEASEAPRPWLETDIAPERATATETETIVHYALTLRNVGRAEARNIRIDSRLFNAGSEAEIAGFLDGPIHEVSGSPHITIAPGDTLRLMGQVAMPITDVREIELQGRRIFVPAVAINVGYDWADGKGRTSRSWLVGREAPQPADKMGAFRLDLGPRIYRQVGRREARRVMV